MVRILVFLILLLPVALGLSYVADQPGSVTLTLAGQAYEVSLLVALGAIAALGLILMFGWSLVSFSLRLPGLISLSNRMRRRSKGITAVSRGMVAVGSGDARTARQQANEAERLLGREPLTLLLKAQAAQLSGERNEAEAAFTSMLETPETRVLGLRGLFVEARRRNDGAAARAHAEEAHTLAPTVPWASRSVLEYASLDRDWPAAIAAVERSASRNVLTRAEARRLKAVLMTAQAGDVLERSPDEALRTSLAALKLEPGLTPAALIAGRRLSEKADFSKASKVLETSFKALPHPEVAEAYIEVRRGDSARDRLKRARVLAKAATGARESRFIVARAALDAREFRLARENLEALVLDKPTARACLLMAELEEMEHGRSGPAREWLARASRAPRDPVWIADGHVSEHWAPISPLSGRIDAYEWKEPPQAIETSVRAEMDAEHFRHHDEEAGAIAPPAPETVEAIGPSVPVQSVSVLPAPSPTQEMAAAQVSAESELAPVGMPVAPSEPVANGHDPVGAAPAEASAVEAAPPDDMRRAPRRRFGHAKPTPIIFPVGHAPDDPGTRRSGS